MDSVQAKNREYYNEHAKEWAVEFRRDSFFNQLPFGMCFIRNLTSGARVLDIGCGLGREVPMFLGAGDSIRYTGMDLSLGMVQVARENYPGLTFFVGDITNHATLPDKKYDAFWASSSLQHIPSKEWPQMLGNIEHIMERGALGFFSVPKDRKLTDGDTRYFETYNDKKVEGLLNPQGWKILFRGALRVKEQGSATQIWLFYIVRLP